MKEEMRPAVATGAEAEPSVQVSVVVPAAIRLLSSRPSAAVMETTGIVIGDAPTTVGSTRPGWLL